MREKARFRTQFDKNLSVLNLIAQFGGKCLLKSLHQINKPKDGSQTRSSIFYFFNGVSVSTILFFCLDVFKGKSPINFNIPSWSDCCLTTRHDFTALVSFAFL